MHADVVGIKYKELQGICFFGALYRNQTNNCSFGYHLSSCVCKYSWSSNIFISKQARCLGSLSLV